MCRQPLTFTLCLLGALKMLRLFKRRKNEREACSKIGIELHRQIKEAFKVNEQQTTERLYTSFMVGYFYYFVRMGFFTITGIPGEQAADKHLQQILDKVLPNKLYEIFNDQLAALEVARNIKEQNEKIGGMEISPSAAIQLFEAGAKFGMYDGTHLSSIYSGGPNSLKRYLIGELDNLSVQV